MARIDAVCILCTARDFWLARIAAASVRYWSPEIPIRFIRDPVYGVVDSIEAERVLGATALDTLSQPCGWGFARLELLVRFPGQRLLILDADTVLCGDLVSALSNSDADFVISPDAVEASHIEEMQRYSYDFESLRRLDPEFERPRWLFTSGHLVATSGLLDRAAFERWVQWTSPMRLTHPECFFCGDQGVLNYVLAHAERCGRVSVECRHFAILASSPELSRIRLEAIRQRRSEPFVVHYNGRKPMVLFRFPRPELLAFFESCYYAKVPFGGWKRCWRFAISVARALLVTVRRAAPFA
jgi:hypothetical protein